MPPITLYTRADDMGLNRGSNLGVMETALHGAIRNISIMVVTPGFEEAVSMLRQNSPDCALGLHIALTSEWAPPGPRWGPAAPPEKVPTLLDEDGCFYPSARRRPEDHRFDPEEVLLELEHQHQRAMSTGLPFSYFDSHMVTLGLAELEGVAAAFARRTGWIDVDARFPNLPKPAGSPPLDDPWDHLCQRLEAAQPGHYRVINHPAVNDASMQQLQSLGAGVPGVAEKRDANRRFLLEPDLEERLRQRGVALGRFDRCDPSISRGASSLTSHSHKPKQT